MGDVRRWPGAGLLLALLGAWAGCESPLPPHELEDAGGQRADAPPADADIELLDAGSPGGGDPFAAGAASVTFESTESFGFDTPSVADPNLWDMAHSDGELYAVVVSAQQDVIAKLEPTVNEPSFVEEVSLPDVAPNLAIHDGAFVIDVFSCESGDPCIQVRESADMTRDLPQRLTGGNHRGMVAFGDVLYQLGAVDGACQDAAGFGLHTTPLDGAGAALSLCVPPGIDRVAASQEVLLTFECQPAGDCTTNVEGLRLRSFAPDGDPIQSLDVSHAFGTVSGVSYDDGTLVVADGLARELHRFSVAASPDSDG